MFDCYFRKAGCAIEFIDQELSKQDLKSIVDPVVNHLDKLTYLTVLHRIWTENTSSVLNFRITDSSYYWLANKYMIDYASSVFNLKEYIEHYFEKGKNSSVYAPVKEAYERDQSWMKLLCEFRNYLTHHASLIKQYEGYSGELIIDMDDFVDYEIADRRRDPHWNNFLSWLKQMRDDSEIMGNMHYYRAPSFVYRANQEIKAVLDNVYKVIIDEQALSGFQTLLSLIHKEEGTYCLTYYENEDTEEKLYPSQLLRDYYASMIPNIEADSMLSKWLICFSRESKYCFDI